VEDLPCGVERVQARQGAGQDDHVGNQGASQLDGFMPVRGFAGNEQIVALDQGSGSGDGRICCWN
jgi:hypothetical protein